MTNKTMTIGAQLDADGDLARQFEEFQNRNSFETQSEAIRALVRDSLERDQHQHQQPDQTHRSTRSSDEQTLDLIEGNEPTLLAVALLVGFDGILSAMKTLAGAAGAWAFIGLSLAVGAWFFADVVEISGLAGEVGG